MAERALRVCVRTPREIVAELDALSLRVPTDSGQVGLRPRCEAAVLALEPGLVLIRTATGARFLATAGGLLRCDGRRAVVLTPIAVVGDDAEGVRRQLERALASPSAELELRRAAERLESAILRELRRASMASPGAAEPLS